MTIQKILVVDDSETDRFYLSEMLTGAAYDVETLDSGKECLDLTAGIQPDLIIIDIIMPDITGFQVARSLTKNEETSHIPIILTSGKLQVTDIAWAQKMGAKSCLLKPVNKEELMAVIEGLN